MIVYKNIKQRGVNIGMVSLFILRGLYTYTGIHSLTQAYIVQCPSEEKATKAIGNDSCANEERSRPLTEQNNIVQEFARLNNHRCAMVCDQNSKFTQV